MKQVTITVACPQGGVGKSTVSHEIAIAASLTNINGDHIRTCLVDSNLNFGSQAHFFGANPKYNITDFVSECNELHKTMTFAEVDEYYAKWENIEKFLTYIPDYHLYLLPAPSNGRHYEISHNEMDQLFFHLKQHFDVIVCDTGNNNESVTLAAIILADIPIIIATDDETTIRNIERLRKRLRMDRSLPINNFDDLMGRIRLVVNKYSMDEKKNYYSIQEIESITYMNLAGVLPDNKDTWLMANLKNPIVTDTVQSPLKKELLKLSHALVPEINEKGVKK